MGVWLMSGAQDSQQTEVVARAVVRRIDFQRRLVLVILLLFSALSCVGVVYYNKERAKNYNLELEAVIKLIAQADEAFGKLVSKPTLQPSTLEAAAEKASQALLNCQNILGSMWSPKPYAALHNCFASAVGTHATFYRRVGEFATKPEPDSSDQLNGAWKETQDAYRLFLESATGMKLPSLPKLSTASAKRAAGFTLAAEKKYQAIVELRKYCKAIDGWKRRYDNERNRFASALGTIRIEATTSYYTSTSETERGLHERIALQRELQYVAPPSVFAAFHRSLTAAVRNGYLAAFYYHEYAKQISRSPWGPDDYLAQRFRSEADDYNQRVDKALATSWNSFQALRKKYLTDPAKTQVVPAKIDWGWRAI
jgi:hypothetical protein